MRNLFKGWNIKDSAGFNRLEYPLARLKHKNDGSIVVLCKCVNAFVCVTHNGGSFSLAVFFYVRLT